ncbi:MAG: hypothetical protein KJO07_21675 [Deltaproteobacteria bacterium]|nr:hypothetical protein [Deltaproteobacteria bacterium]
MIKRTFASRARRALLRRGRALLRRSEQNGAGPADFLGGLSGKEREELAEIHQALERIERGIFGKCEGCSQKIDEALLEPKPWRRLCDDCTGDEANADTTESGDSATNAHVH